MKTCLALLMLTGAVMGHDINGGGWEPNEDLSGSMPQIIAEPSLLDFYAINDAMIYVAQHPKRVGDSYEIGETHAIQGHHIAKGDLIEKYAATFGFTVDCYYDAIKRGH